MDCNNLSNIFHLIWTKKRADLLASRLPVARTIKMDMGDMLMMLIMMVMIMTMMLMGMVTMMMKMVIMTMI